ncbi:CYC02 protein [Plutella xylostella]|uniref:CYC02 protein n=1 Tax=Plutella xylostella TaxID=51655 RepID=UPI002032B51C|nr:CYC02 protein [Plutella xylostella]
MKLTFVILFVTLCALSANGYSVPDLQKVNEETYVEGQDLLDDPRDCKCDHNCRVCIKNKCMDCAYPAEELEAEPLDQGSASPSKCNPNRCDSNCRWCFNGKCHCDWQ